MKTLGIIFTLIFTFAVLALVIGLIKPFLVIPGRMLKTRVNVFKVYLSIIFISFIAVGFTAPQNSPADVQNNSETTTKQISIVKATPKQGIAQPYKVVNNRDYSFAGRKRMQWTINAPQAVTKEDRAMTAIQAAKDLQDQTNADQTNIFLVITGLKGAFGMPLAVVAYTPDGKSNSGESNDPVWEVEASADQLTEMQEKITVAWYKHKSNFLKDSGVTDEPILIEFLAKKLNLPQDQITTPWIKRSKVTYSD